MIPKFTRTQIIDQLQKTAQSRRPIIGAGSSMGLIAKCAENAGADLIIVYSTGISRLKGLPTTPIGDSNSTTLSMFDEINNVVYETPIIGGAEPSDPQHLDLKHLLDKFEAKGFSGVINMPTVGVNPQRDRQRQDVGLGYSRDVEMMRLARERDLFSMAYVFDPDQAKAMAEAGVDCIVAHLGWTVGGMVGANASALAAQNSAKAAEDMFVAARVVDEDILLLSHGAHIATPEDTAAIYAETQAQGFVGASSIERIPVEKAVTDVVNAFKAISMI